MDERVEIAWGERKQRGREIRIKGRGGVESEGAASAVGVRSVRDILS